MICRIQLYNQVSDNCAIIKVLFYCWKTSYRAKGKGSSWLSGNKRPRKGSWLKPPPYGWKERVLTRTKTEHQFPLYPHVASLVMSQLSSQHRSYPVMPSSSPFSAPCSHPLSVNLQLHRIPPGSGSVYIMWSLFQSQNLQRTMAERELFCVCVFN